VVPSAIAIALVLASFTAAGLVVAGAVLLTVSRRAEHRPAPPGTLTVAAIAIGVSLGDLLLFTTRLPFPRLAVLATVAGVVVACLFANRPATGGAFLLAIAAPWTAWYAIFVADNAFGAGHWSTDDVVPALAAGAVAIAVGAAMIAIGRPIEARAHPPAPPETRRPWNALSRALLGPRLLGLSLHESVLTVIVVAIAIGNATVVHGRPFVVGSLITLLSVALAFALSAAVWVVARRPAERRAMEAYVYLGEHDLDRFRAQAGGPAVPSLRDFKRFVDATPPRQDLEWIRSEIFAVLGRLADARASAEAMPTTTPIERVERASTLAYVDWLDGGRGDLASLRAAAGDVLPIDSPDRLRAEVITAAGETRVAIGEGLPDPLRPLRAVRDRLGARADGILWTALRRRAWPSILRLSVFAVAGATVLDRLSNLG
jgi:hypothetical protein